jgi:hypothetical protein
LPEIERWTAGGDTTLRGISEDRLATEIIASPLEPASDVTSFRNVHACGNIRGPHKLDAHARLYDLSGPDVALASALSLDAGFIANSFFRFRRGAPLPPLGRRRAALIVAVLQRLRRVGVPTRSSAMTRSAGSTSISALPSDSSPSFRSRWRIFADRGLAAVHRPASLSPQDRDHGAKVARELRLAFFARVTCSTADGPVSFARPALREALPACVCGPHGDGFSATRSSSGHRLRPRSVDRRAPSARPVWSPVLLLFSAPPIVSRRRDAQAAHSAAPAEHHGAVCDQPLTHGA